MWCKAHGPLVDHDTGGTDDVQKDRLLVGSSWRQWTVARIGEISLGSSGPRAKGGGGGKGGDVKAISLPDLQKRYE